MSAARSLAQDSDYGWLFAANVMGIFATGIATVALALLAFHLAGDDTGIVLATALSLKMAMNVFVPPIASAYAMRFPRRSWLTSLNLVRAAVLCLLPYVTEVHQIYLLIIIFEAAAAAFRATYLAIVPDMLPDDWQYAGAVAKARIAYNAESMLSPLIASALLFVVDVRGIFIVSVIALLLATVVLLRVMMPEGKQIHRGFVRRMALKYRILFAAPMFRGAFAIHAAATVISAMVAVNTVVIVRGVFDLDDQSAAISLATFGAGGIVGSLVSRQLISTFGERSVDLQSAAVMAILLMSGALLQNYAAMLVLWFALGVATTLCQLPIETILRRMTEAGDRPTVYAAHYSVSCALLLVSYQAAGWVGAEAGLTVAFVCLGLLSATMAAVAAAVWPVNQASR